MNDSRSRLFPRKGLARQALQEHSDPSATAVISSSLPCLLRRRTQCHDTPGSYASVAKPPHQTPPRCLTCSRDRPIPAPAHLQDHSQFEKRRENFAKEIDIAIVDVVRPSICADLISSSLLHYAGFVSTSQSIALAC